LRGAAAGGCVAAFAPHSRGSITDKRGFYGDMEQAKLSFTAKEEKPRLAMRM